MNHKHMQVLREAGSDYLRFVIKNGEADAETEDFIEKELYIREQRTFFDGKKHTPV